MRSLVTFTKKEFLDQLRSGKLMLLGLIFVLFGIMNPAVAKLTPWLLESMADSLAASGMVVTSVTVSAMDSWVQFYKNMPMALIAFVLPQSGIFTKEYQHGTLILSLTKGLHRYKVVISKTFVLTTLWSLCFWLCFAITYGYNAYFWDNSIAHNLLFSVICWWLFGLWVTALVVLFSIIGTSNSFVLTGTGGIVFLTYLLSIHPRLKEFLPTYLTDGNSLIYAAAETSSYHTPLIITIVTMTACFAASIPLFNKKKL